MTASLHWKSIAALAGIAWASYSFATMIPSEKLKLGAREQGQLEAQICGDGQKAERIDAQRIQTNPPTLTARVTCVSHEAFAGYPVLKTGECEKGVAGWKCSGPVAALRMQILSDELLLEYVDSVTPGNAIELVKFIRSVPTFNGQNVSMLLAGRCRISDGHTSPFPGALNFNYDCEGPSASITKDCWENRCRLFFTEFGIWVP